ncbi:MAG: metallophosphoesterase [Syntrophomonadaceae bacterium]
MVGKRKLMLIIALIAMFLLAAFYNGLVVRQYTIETERLAAGESVRIVLVTDLHSHIYGKNQTGIIALIKKQNPDVIALAGDIVDDQAPIKGAEMFLTELKNIAPVYYVTGNHEFWSDDIANIKKTIRQYGITVLENNYEQIMINNASIIIGGVDDPEVVYEKPGYNWPEEILHAFSALQNKPDYKILLSHRPELVEIYRETCFDLVLSGHAHGGQVRIPFLLNGLYAPNQGWFPPYAGGMYNHCSLTHIVSRGVSYNPRLPRIFNPPEIVVVEIKGL